MNPNFLRIFLSDFPTSLRQSLVAQTQIKPDVETIAIS